MTAAHEVRAERQTAVDKQKQTTLVILINTDIEYQGSEPATTLATAITKELTPDHIYSLGR